VVRAAIPDGCRALSHAEKARRLAGLACRRKLALGPVVVGAEIFRRPACGDSHDFNGVADHVGGALLAL